MSAECFTLLFDMIRINGIIPFFLYEKNTFQSRFRIV